MVTGANVRRFAGRRAEVPVVEHDDEPGVSERLGVPVSSGSGPVVMSRLDGPDVEVPPWAVVGLGRQDELLSRADLVICGGGHGLVSKALLAGVPLVVIL